MRDALPAARLRSPVAIVCPSGCTAKQLTSPRCSVKSRCEELSSEASCSEEASWTEAFCPRGCTTTSDPTGYTASPVPDTL
eukprot:1666484-Rhodomonas_salina.6